ncbi:hypothetical protein C8E83_1041 [Frondihabitans australicus]|uniref:Uncharacterized protein n=2 Tax=Frondihabitans australicus TaxID=386892 RepID=A0A495IF21_9MICO|nr:hypothetical protein C8E83_1041 [Frondihabitans australicus]
MNRDKTGSYRGPQSEDLQFKLTGSATEFELTCESEVQFMTVANHDHVLGLLWYSDSSLAAAFANRQAAGDIGLNAGVAWHEQLSTAYARGLRPSEAIAFFATVDLGLYGRIKSGAPQVAANSAEVEAIAEAPS